MSQPDHLLLKWGTLKSWQVSSPKAAEALQEFFGLGVPWGAMLHHPTERQKELLCIVIDECDGTIQKDWDGEMLTKQAAKDYVMGSQPPAGKKWVDLGDDPDGDIEGYDGGFR